MSKSLEGLTHLGSAELAFESWSFDLVDAWKGPDGIYIGTDSGCSCPSPFEWLRSVDQLTGPLTVDQAVEEVTSLGTTAWRAKESAVREEIRALVEAIRAA